MVIAAFWLRSVDGSHGKKTAVTHRKGSTEMREETTEYRF